MFFSLGLTADAAAAHSNGPPASTRPGSKGSLPAAGTSSVIISKLSAVEAPLAQAEDHRQTQTQTQTRSGSGRSRRSAMTVGASHDGGDSPDSCAVTISPPPRTPDTQSLRTLNTPSRARGKTSYHLAHPPPSFMNRQRLRIRPRLLLQLQRVSTTSRPSPALDVHPSTILPPALARKFPSLFRGRDRLGADDLVIATSEAYGSAESDGRNKIEELDARHVVATVSQRRRDRDWRQGKAEICLSDGSVWEATPLPRGAYEFVAVDEHGLSTIARWVPRRSAGAAAAAGAAVRGKSPSPDKDEKRFSFSLINPSQRRHPIIASMSRSSIDVLDTYPTSAPPATPQSPSSDAPHRTSFFDAVGGGGGGGGGGGESAHVETNDALRTLILVTGIWVAFREGWSQNFSYDDPMSSTGNAPSSSSTGAARPPTSSRSASNTVNMAVDARHLSPGGPDAASRAAPRLAHRSSAAAATATPSEGASPSRRRAQSAGYSLLRRRSGDSSRRHRKERSTSVFSILSARHQGQGHEAPGTGAEQVGGAPPQDGGREASVPTEDEYGGGFSTPLSTPRPPPARKATDSGDDRPGHTTTKDRWGKLKTLIRFSKRQSPRQ
ncbi:MAG: hypothetical protein M1815_004070 [Lichina confinis]|nr:MAG: hypothetical protein M1815_004070 [Lichina confinis]